MTKVILLLALCGACIARPIPVRVDENGTILSVAEGGSARGFRVMVEPGDTGVQDDSGLEDAAGRRLWGVADGKIVRLARPRWPSDGTDQRAYDERRLAEVIELRIRLIALDIEKTSGDSPFDVQPLIDAAQKRIAELRSVP